MSATAAAPPRGLHIGDDERPAGDGATFAVLDPADGSAIAEVASATASVPRSCAARSS